MIEYTFTSVSQLIEKTEKYKNRKKRQRDDPEPFIPYNVDMERLVWSIEPLKKLNKLIGMEELKKNILDQILFFSQQLNTNEMMHTCLTGPPGVGKTTLGKILAELYCSMGFLKTDNFRVVTSSDLIAGYIGQTAIKTKKVLKESLGGVLFIDEAYSLGSKDPDSVGYSKECIDTINVFLSENTSNFILIIAGYSDDLEKSFFSLNQGLRRRFPWTYDISKYSIKSLVEIFIYQVFDNKWEFDEELVLNNHKNLFKT
jgi:SpoVK/Ycf46/Vps4 family AAA+-type ATPase